MNVNPLLMELQNITGVITVPDYYEGKADKWITFTYEDERPGQLGDNGVTDDIAYMQISLFTPGKYNYMELKEKIKTYLESIGVVTGVQSWIEKKENQTYVRHTVFTAELTKEREE